jgi:chemotaxis protein CheZ
MNEANMNDSLDLEALFESQTTWQPKETQPAPQPTTPAGAVKAEPAPAPKAKGKRSAKGSKEASADHVINQIGQMTRNLHDALRDLGYDKLLEKAAQAIPDTRERLNYVVTMTKQAADKVLNAVDAAKPVQDEIEEQAQALSARWDKVFTNELGVDEFKRLAIETRGYLADVPQKTAATNAHLMEIMMAQDFQDLTGQVIKKISDLVQNLEHELLNLLVEYAPSDKREVASGLLNGPVVNAQGRCDVVTSQAQVDDLLASLGF